MKKSFLIHSCLLLFFAITAQAQNQYDIFNYKIPAGFKQTTKTNTVLMLEKNEGKNYCQLTLYAAVQAQADAEKDFIKNWDFFARNPQQGIANPETRDTGSLNNWQMLFGAAKGKYNNQMFALTLSSFTKNNINYYIGAVFTDKKYIPVAQEFIAGVLADEKKFAVVKKQQPAPSNNTGASSNNTTATSGKSKRIAQPSLTFNDGWTSTAYDDYVSIIKNGTEVRLIFPDAQVDNSRPQNTSVFEPHYWDNILKKYYRVTGQPLVKEKPQYSYGENDIWLAPATDIATGRQGHVAMILSAQNGNTAVITVFAPNAAYFNTNFTGTADFNRMWGYNKYNATVSDIIGEWKNSSGAGMEYYNIYTGNSVGMATAHVSDRFVFNNNGTYQSEHTGTSTFQGSVSHGKSNYSGTYSLNDVTLTATGRAANDPGEFTCYFEAVKYGFTLRLINKKFSGENMILYRVK
ncbi:MAG: hypothetical protein K2X48_12610 [Chitinophagaceae bacterium]|nr:hypothetical protein [Chitinophagaceae bacterium]